MNNATASALDSVEIISVHVPKTAGATFGHIILPQIYRLETIFYDYESLPVEVLQDKITSKTKVIHGHFPAIKYQNAYPNAKIIVWLRNPINRLISWYYFWLTFPTNKPTSGKFHKYVVNNQIGFEEFINCQETQNRISRYYCQGINLENFQFIGIQEFFREDFCELQQLLNWPEVKVTPSNRNTYPDYEDLVKSILSDRRLIGKIVSLNSADMELYQNALNLRAKRKGFSTSWQQYQVCLSESRQRIRFFNNRTLNQNNKKKLVVIANCQGEALVKTLQENPEFSSTYEWIFLPYIQYLNKSHISEVLEKVILADLFLYQPISLTSNRPEELTSDFLVKQLKRDAVSLSFPSLYFDGYFPHLGTFKGHTSVLNLVHDYIIAYSCLIGLSENETIQLIQSDDLYSTEVSLQLLERSLKDLKERESRFKIDIRVSDYIESNYKYIKLFNHFSHPTKSIFKYISQKILDILTIDNTIKSEGIGYLDAIITPIYKSTYVNLNLQFIEDFDSYKGVTGNVKTADVVFNFFELYSKFNLSEIKLHIAQAKPFIPQIVESRI